MKLYDVMEAVTELYPEAPRGAFLTHSSVDFAGAVAELHGVSGLDISFGPTDRAGMTFLVLGERACYAVRYLHGVVVLLADRDPLSRLVPLASALLLSGDAELASVRDERVLGPAGAFGPGSGDR